MKNVIYYFTGTGNSMRAAVKIAKRLGDTETISMRSNPSEVSAIDCDTIAPVTILSRQRERRPFYIIVPNVWLVFPFAPSGQLATN